jgi:hypothetical protein
VARLGSVVRVEAFDDVMSGFFVALKHQQLAQLCFFEQFSERAEAVKTLVESGLAAVECLLDHGRPDFVLGATVFEKRFDGFHDQIQRFRFLVATVLVCIVLFGNLGSGSGLGRSGAGGRFFSVFLLLLLGFFARKVVVENELVAVGD